MIWDVQHGPRIRIFPIPDPDPGVKKALDPGSGVTTKLWAMTFFV
jgi:hypothetical protein